MCATNDMALRKCLHVSIFTHHLKTSAGDIRKGGCSYRTSIFSVTNSLNREIRLCKINFLLHIKLLRPIMKRSPSRLYKETDDGSEVRPKRLNTCCGKNKKNYLNAIEAGRQSKLCTLKGEEGNLAVSRV